MAASPMSPRQGRGRYRPLADINVTPLVDVMLVLLIIFMITAPLLTQGIKVDLPKAPAEPLSLQRNQDPLVLSIDSRGRLYLNIGAHPRDPIDDETALIRATVALRRDPERAVLVNGDQAVNYGRVVQAMGLLQQAGAHQVGFETASPSERARGGHPAASTASPVTPPPAPPIAAPATR